MKNELQTLRRFSPLFPHICRKREWGDLDDYRENLSTGEILEYEDKILALIQKEKLHSEGKRGLAVYLTKISVERCTVCLCALIRRCSWLSHPLYAADVPHRAVVVYCYLKGQTNDDGTCCPAIGTIAKDLKRSRRTVQRAIADLEKTGHLQKEQRWRENGGKSSLLFTVK